MLKFERTRCCVCNSRDSREKYRIKSAVPFTVVECRKCGMVYVNPVVSNLKALYEKDYYHGKSRTGFNFSDPLAGKNETKIALASRLEKIEKTTGIKKGRLLDIGCTFGLFVKTALDAGWNAYGSDISGYAVRQAKKLGIKNVRVGLDFRENYFDVVTLYEVIEHVDKPLEEMRKISALLKKGGWIVIHTGNLGSLTAKIRGAANPYFQLGHVNYFSKKTLKELMEKAGFRVARLDTYTEKIEPAKIKSGIATPKDYWRLLYYTVFEKTNVSGSMICFAQKI